MIIEKRGYFEDGSQRFDCINCGSVFVATKEEYTVVDRCAYTSRDYKINCPVCGRTCYKNAN